MRKMCNSLFSDTERQRPTLMQNLTNQDVNSSSTLTLVCLAGGVPDPDIKWYKDKTPVTEGPGEKTLNGFMCGHRWNQLFYIDFKCRSFYQGSGSVLYVASFNNAFRYHSKRWISDHWEGEEGWWGHLWMSCQQWYRGSKNQCGHYCSGWVPTLYLPLLLTLLYSI